MKAEINITDHLADTLDFMADCDGPTPDEYIQERVILCLQDWLHHIKGHDPGTTRTLCGHCGGSNTVANFATEDHLGLLTPIQRCSVA